MIPAEIRASLTSDNTPLVILRNYTGVQYERERGATAIEAAEAVVIEEPVGRVPLLTPAQPAMEIGNLKRPPETERDEERGRRRAGD